MLPPRRLGDLDWMALRHALGELGNDDARAFEHLLATDQSAREALARAVERLELLQVVTRLVDVPCHRSSSRRPRLSIRIVAAAATILAAVGWAWWDSRHRTDEFNLSASMVIGPPEIALAWADLRDQGHEIASRPSLLDESLRGAAEFLEIADSETVLLRDTGNDSQEPLPSWLMEATLLKSSSEGESDEPSAIEEGR